MMDQPDVLPVLQCGMRDSPGRAKKTWRHVDFPARGSSS